MALTTRNTVARIRRRPRLRAAAHASRRLRNPYPADYGYPAALPAKTNTLAIISLVGAVVGLLCGVGSIIGIVCGAVALNQIKRTREGGHGLAVAGIVIGVASLVISIVWMTFAWR